MSQALGIFTALAISRKETLSTPSTSFSLMRKNSTTPHRMERPEYSHTTYLKPTVTSVNVSKRYRPTKETTTPAMPDRPSLKPKSLPCSDLSPSMRMTFMEAAQNVRMVVTPHAAKMNSSMA